MCPFYIHRRAFRLHWSIGNDINENDRNENNRNENNRNENDINENDRNENDRNENDRNEWGTMRQGGGGGEIWDRHLPVP